MDLSISYMGLKLTSPIIVSSSRLTSSADNVRLYAKQGAGAVVLKSLFEEQIIADIEIKLEDHPMYFWYPRAADHIKDISKDQGLNEYLALIAEAKKETHIPVIASVNCITAKEWPGFAKRIQDAGADGLELNISIVPFDDTVESLTIEDAYIDIINEVKQHVTIPIAVKIGSGFTNITRMVKRMDNAGVNAVVMFNRFFRPDLNIDDESEVTDNYFSSPVEITEPLRWIGALSNKVKCDLAASTGIHDYTGVVKVILAGAAVAQICSTVYKNGPEVIGIMLKDLESWMDKHHYKNPAEFKGKILKGREKTGSFERVQFMRKTTGLNL
jgi:dihydroorotate dehydrogenase (fumarate)